MPHDPGRIGAEQVILHRRPMRSDNDKFGAGLFGQGQNFRINAVAVPDENVGIEVGSIDLADQGGEPDFQIAGDYIIAEWRRLRLQDGVDIAHHGEGMKPGAERAREFDGREQGKAGVPRRDSAAAHQNVATERNRRGRSISSGVCPIIQDQLNTCRPPEKAK